MSVIITVSGADVIQQKLLDVVADDTLGLFAASEWHKFYQKYVPVQSGAMYSAVEIRPWEIEHTSPYAHYQYEGKVYGPNSPRGRKKHPTGGKLHYTSGTATDHWDQKAAQTQMDKLEQSLAAFIVREANV